MEVKGRRSGGIRQARERSAHSPGPGLGEGTGCLCPRQGPATAVGLAGCVGALEPSTWKGAILQAGINADPRG
jgi:hypothetical protein